MLSRLQFHQALFGYDAGHHLLASSTQLSSDVRHLLAVATDLSGSAPPTSFDSAYTGLPLKGTSYYALFCTWLAPEMSRPGCVWGHVLLIQWADLAEIEDLGALRGCFRRPSMAELKYELSEYSEPFRFVPDKYPFPIRFNQEQLAIAENLLGALYFSPERQIVVTVNDSRITEDLVFALWSQQWPRLRETFRFSTGSFADRGRSNAPYDLQVSPEANRRAWFRGTGYLVLNKASADDIPLPSDARSWIVRSVEDLTSPNIGGFRTFLRKFGADVKTSRSSFCKLASLYERVTFRANASWTRTLDAVGEMFPDPTEALLLKEQVVSPSETQDPEQSLITASYLLTSDRSKPYEAVSLEVTLLAQGLWDSRRSAVLALLVDLAQHQEQPSAIAFVTAMANLVRPNDLQLIASERPESIPLFVSHRAELACNVEIWKLPVNMQARVAEVLDGLNLPPETWGEIMAAMLLAETNLGVRNAVEKAGSFAIDAAFRWLDSPHSQEHVPPQIWRDALSVRAAERLRASNELSPSSLVLCTWLVPSEVLRLSLNASRGDIQALAKQPIESLPLPLRLHAAFLLVTLGLRAGNTNGILLLVAGFFRVYDALATGDYSSESWLLLSPELPHIGAWREWDRCKKLRRAVRERFSSLSGQLSKALKEVAGTKEHLGLVHKLFSS